ncbi:MAG: HAMP domain-containing protein [Myxococcales bacterium]|nr:MAG: HAMP domain-containing protein [Myxococcales bacterium]
MTPEESTHPPNPPEENPAQAYSPLEDEPPIPRGEPTSDELKRLLARPKLSIRTRLILAFSLIFTFATIMNVWMIYTLSALQAKIHFLEVADSYMGEIQQARRFEKNYLLYKTNLDDALEHVRNAQQLLKQNRSMVERVVSAKNFLTITQHTQDYEGILRQLEELSDPAAREKVEVQLRDHGSEMISFAGDFARRERESVDKTFLLVRRISYGFLTVLLAMMLIIGIFLAKQILDALSRFMEYTNRIAEGDFTHITPRRKYRDEFTQLALAFNHMIDELEHRHQVLVESHKIRAIGSLVAGVAHELNNPLNNIMLTASTLKEDYGDYEEAEKIEMVSEIIEEAERSQRIVRNLLDFARESKTNIEPLNIENIVRRSVQLVANQMKISKVCMKLGIPKDLPPVHGDGQLLCQVFVNLLLNAIDVVPVKGEVKVSARTNNKDGFVAVDVTDSGPGIPEHILQRIFEPFFTTKTKGKGTGLGLSVSRGIVRKLGGYIQVKSEVGKGTTFTVLLPKTEIPFKQDS